ncbi:Ribose ABC transport system, ATP-binding protein RbsA (TC 3.A.1.2.1) [Actinomycetales bacterium JB111]|nr:Ribose ABC transport system, ATP-binding protein RbsA (TC 3.A.1.2.1) [Actinomycetales bacterium JB111]
MATLEITGASKRYGGVRALDNAHLKLKSGEVHGLLGPNGSGKSTLNKIISGAVNPDAVTIELDGSPITINRPLDAHKHGIASVYQHLSLVPHLTVEQNLVLGTEAAVAGFLSPRKQRQRIHEILERLEPGLGPRVRPDTKVSRLGPGQRQVIEFGKAWLKAPRFLVLDEATASMHRDQVQLVFDVVREMTAEDIGVVFVSHRMEEVLTLCQRATILRNGLNIDTVELENTTDSELVRLMVGDELAERVGSAHVTNRVEGSTAVLTTENLSAEGISDVSLELHPGEVVGLGGLQGQGQSDLLLSLFGANPATGGRITMDGAPVSLRRPRRSIRAGIALVPGDRGDEGLYAKRSIQENISTVSLAGRSLLRTFLSMGKERSVAREQVKAMSIKIGSLDHPVSSLSGGNQQKVVIAKWLPANPKVVLLDDPTKGVDVGAKAEIYSIVRALTEQGVAVLFNSSDDIELEELADRVLVMYEGNIVDELVGEQITHSALVAAALRVDEDPEEMPA